MSGLFHLVEAATALSQLGQSNLPPSTAYRVASSSSASSIPTTTPTSPVAAPSFVCDDDETLATKAACTKIAILRENHLRALRVAAANAGLATTSPVAASPTVGYHPIANRPSMALAAPAPLAVATTTTPHAQRQATSSSGADRPSMALAAPAPLAVATPTTTHAQQATSPSVAAAAASPPIRCSAVFGGGDPASATCRATFPLRLHALLADPTVRDVISWLPYGRSFIVLRPDVFANRVLPRHFAPEGASGHHAKVAAGAASTTDAGGAGAHKYPSFTRKLNRWGFRQISRGPYAGAFCHDLFQRDDPGLCRGMVCQKSRKAFSSSSSRCGQLDDVMSVSSASTMGGTGGDSRSVASFGNGQRGGEKWLYSSTVTVSTAGQNNINNGNTSVSISNKSLPFKKRKSNGQQVAIMSDIPSMISHGYQKMSSSTSSMTESDLTSDNGSVCSGGNRNMNTVFVAPKALSMNVALGGNNLVTAGKVLAKETLARHFHEQQRAFALASLLENSRRAIESAGIAVRDQRQLSHLNLAPLVTVVAAPPMAYAPVVVEQKKMDSVVPGAAGVAMPPVSSVEAARAALFKSYMQAMMSVDATATTSSLTAMSP
jgi:hypothetical protein